MVIQTPIPARTVVALTAALVLTSCTHEPPKQPASTPENKDHSTTRWIPNRAVDLMSPEGTFIRAATESFSAAQTTTGDPTTALHAGGYPGYEHAFNNSWKPAEVFGANPSRNVIVGTSYREVVSLAKDGDHFKAGICSYDSQLADQLPNGHYRTTQMLGSGRWLTFGPDPKLSPQEQYSPMTNQKGPASRPTDNVFGTWIVFKDTVLTADTLPQCNSPAPGTSKDFRPGEHSDPPPTLPPDPGWPDAGTA